MHLAKKRTDYFSIRQRQILYEILESAEHQLGRNVRGSFPPPSPVEEDTYRSKYPYNSSSDSRSSHSSHTSSSSHSSSRPSHYYSNNNNRHSPPPTPPPTPPRYTSPRASPSPPPYTAPSPSTNTQYQESKTTGSSFQSTRSDALNDNSKKRAVEEDLSEQSSAKIAKFSAPSSCMLSTFLFFFFSPSLS